MFETFAETKRESLALLEDVARLAAGRGHPTIARQLGLFRDQLADLRYNVAIVGEMNRGKSTLLNTLLGRRDDLISPVRVKVCTSAIVTYLDRRAHGREQEEAVVRFDDGREPEQVAFADLAGFVTEEGNPENRLGVRAVDVYGDFPLLNDAVVLVDTPGHGAIPRHHGALLDEFLPVADAILLLISAELPVTASERELLDQLGEGERRRIFYVLTKRDSVEAKDLPLVREYVQRQIREAGLEYRPHYEISAKAVFDALRRGAPQPEVERLRRESGMSRLEKELEDFIFQHSSRSALLLPRIQAALDAAVGYCRQSERQVEDDLASFSLGADKLAAERQTLSAEGEALRRDAKKALERFSQSWDREAARFSRVLRGKADAIATRLLDRMERNNLLNRALASFKLQRMVAREINSECEGPVMDLEAALTKAVNTLHEELRQEWELHPRARRHGIDLAASGAAVGGLIAGGSSVAMAGSGVLGTVSAWTTFAGVTQGAAQAGGLVKLWALLFATSTSAPAFALSAAIAATGAGFAALVVAGGVYWVGKQLISAAQEGRVPALVEDAMGELSTGLLKLLEARKDEIIAAHGELLEEALRTGAERLESVEAALRDQDPTLRDKLAVEATTLRALLERETRVRESLRWLPVGGES